MGASSLQVISMKKNNNSEFLNLLKNVYNLESVKQDKEFSNLLITAINNLNSGNAKDIEIVRLEPFINKYLFSNPSQELIDLNLYMQKKQNKYRGLSSIINWLF
ncbi:hypothetical protein ADO07_00022 [Streptococcus parauberis]|nr:hypothetical protein ADO07_00022 [Streptococcus parauberis]